MPDRKETVAAMHSDADRAFVEMNARLYGFSPEDITKLYDAYGPYAADLFRTALHTPLNIRSVMNPTLVSPENFSITPATKELLDTANGNKPRLTNEQIARIVNKPGIEIAANIAEYQKQQEARKQIDATYQTISGGQNKPTTSVESLLAAGVTPEDFQAVFEQNQGLLGAIGGGPTCTKLAQAADKVVTKYKRDSKTGKMVPDVGNCKTGVDNIHSSANLPTDSIHSEPSLAAMEQDRKEHTYQGGSKGGCNVDEGLLASGDYIVIDVPNTAYLKQYKGPEWKEMNELFLTCQPGVTMSIDAVDDRGTSQAQTAGGKYGHTAVRRSKNSDHKWGCDFAQDDINFSRYGRTAHACYPKDAEVSEEYAKLLIEHAQQRTGQCLNVEENKKAYEAGQRASQSAQRTRTQTTNQNKATAKTGRSSSTSGSKSSASRSKSSTSRSRSSSTTRRTTGRSGR